MSDLSRFTSAQRKSYEGALEEIHRGFKTGHWMWYIFPQIIGLGSSATCLHYSIKNLQEAKDFLADPYLGGNLVEISNALLELPETNPSKIFGWPDDMKLLSCMTLFAIADPTQEVFQKVIDKFYGGERDHRTEYILAERIK